MKFTKPGALTLANLCTIAGLLPYNTFSIFGAGQLYSLSVDNRALDSSSFLLIGQNLVSLEWNGLSHSKIVLFNCSRYSGGIVQFSAYFAYFEHFMGNIN